MCGAAWSQQAWQDMASACQVSCATAKKGSRLQMMEAETVSEVGSPTDRKHNMHQLHRISVAGFVVRLHPSPAPASPPPRPLCSCASASTSHSPIVFALLLQSDPVQLHAYTEVIAVRAHMPPPYHLKELKLCPYGLDHCMFYVQLLSIPTMDCPLLSARFMYHVWVTCGFIPQSIDAWPAREYHQSIDALSPLKHVSPLTFL